MRRVGRFHAPDFQFHIDARSEPVDDRHEAIHGEAPEVRITNAREVGRRRARAAMRAAHAQAFPVERLDDFGGQDRLELFDIRILMPQIAEHVPAAASPDCEHALYVSFDLSILSFWMAVPLARGTSHIIFTFWIEGSVEMSSNLARFANRTLFDVIGLPAF